MKMFKIAHIKLSWMPPATFSKTCYWKWVHEEGSMHFDIKIGPKRPLNRLFGIEAVKVSHIHLLNFLTWSPCPVIWFPRGVKATRSTLHWRTERPIFISSPGLGGHFAWLEEGLRISRQRNTILKKIKIHSCFFFVANHQSHSAVSTRLSTYSAVVYSVQCTVKFTLSDHPSKTVSGDKGRLSQPGTNFELYLSCYNYWFNFVKLQS